MDQREPNYRERNRGVRECRNGRDGYVCDVHHSRAQPALARENKVLRKAETSPRVVAYLALNPRAYGAIDFIVSNIGRGPATNVSYKIIAGGDDLNAKGVRILPATLK